MSRALAPPGRPGRAVRRAAGWRSRWRCWPARRRRWSFAPTEFWWLQLIATGALVALLADAPPRAAAGRAWAFGFGWLAAGFWWLYISLHVYGFLPAWLSALAVAVLAALLALYYAIAGWAWARLRRGRPLVDALLFSAVWLLAELARGSFLTGFPWIAGGYAHTSGPAGGLGAVRRRLRHRRAGGVDLGGDAR